MSLRFRAWAAAGEGGVSVKASGGLLLGAPRGEHLWGAPPGWGPCPGIRFARVSCRGLRGKPGSWLSAPLPRPPLQNSRCVKIHFFASSVWWEAQPRVHRSSLRRLPQCAFCGGNVGPVPRFCLARRKQTSSGSASGHGQVCPTGLALLQTAKPK